MNENESPTSTALEQVAAQLPAAQRTDMYGLAETAYYDHMRRVANMFTKSSLVPDIFRGEAGFPNAIIALDMSNRMKANPLAVMQSMYIVHGKPSWSSTFIIASINTCGRFEPMRFDIEGAGDDRECVAWTTDKGITIPKGVLDRHGARNEGVPIYESPEVSIKMAKAEGWFQKNGSKWQTMPSLMLRYRAATLFGRLYAPELLMGMRTVEEVHDIEVEVLPPNTTERPAGLVYGKKAEVSKTVITTAQETAKEPTKEPAKQEIPPGIDFTTLKRPEMDTLLAEWMERDGVSNAQVVAYARAGKLCGPKIEEPTQFRDDTALHCLTKWAEILPSIRSQKV